jgi:hypothetical protein
MIPGIGFHLSHRGLEKLLKNITDWLDFWMTSASTLGKEDATRTCGEIKKNKNKKLAGTAGFR